MVMPRRILVATLLVAALGFSQEFRATLAGRITDPSGAVVAGARIEVKAVATGAVTTATSAEDGAYQVSFLIPSYSAMPVP